MIHCLIIQTVSERRVCVQGDRAASTNISPESSLYSVKKVWSGHLLTERHLPSFLLILERNLVTANKAFRLKMSRRSKVEPRPILWAVFLSSSMSSKSGTSDSEESSWNISERSFLGVMVCPPHHRDCLFHLLVSARSPCCLLKCKVLALSLDPSSLRLVRLLNVILKTSFIFQRKMC